MTVLTKFQRTLKHVCPVLMITLVMSLSSAPASQPSLTLKHVHLADDGGLPGAQRNCRNEAGVRSQRLPQGPSKVAARPRRPALVRFLRNPPASCDGVVQNCMIWSSTGRNVKCTTCLLEPAISFPYMFKSYRHGNLNQNGIQLAVQ